MFVLFILGFRYNLGFYGSTYQMNAATDKEKHADSFLIENRHQFWWFPPHDLTIFCRLKKSFYSRLSIYAFYYAKTWVGKFPLCPPAVYAPDKTRKASLKRIKLVLK